VAPGEEISRAPRRSTSRARVITASKAKAGACYGRGMPVDPLRSASRCPTRPRAAARLPAKEGAQLSKPAISWPVRFALLACAAPSARTATRLPARARLFPGPGAHPAATLEPFANLTHAPPTSMVKLKRCDRHPGARRGAPWLGSSSRGTRDALHLPCSGTRRSLQFFRLSCRHPSRKWRSV